MSTVSPALPNLSTVTSATASTGSSGQTGTASATGTASTSTGSNASTSSGSVSVITGAPTLTSGVSISKLTGLPTLSGYYSYPAPTVPPTANAPYMQAIHLPQNFVFIVVGAVIAFFALCLIAWHFLAAWSINRKIKRDGAAYTPLHDTKKSAKTEQGHDMADLSALPKSFGNSVPSLFFSPTASAARQSVIRPQSQHMASGHYRDISK